MNIRQFGLIAACSCLVIEGWVLAETRPEGNAGYGNTAPATAPQHSPIPPTAEGPGGSMLHWLSFSGDAAGVAQAITAGYRVDQRLQNGNTPLHIAAYKGHIAVVGVLIDQGADPNARNSEGMTPLDWAEQNGHDEVIKLLRAKGARRSGNPHSSSRLTASVNPPVIESSPLTEDAPVRRHGPLKLALPPAEEQRIVARFRPPAAGKVSETSASERIYRIQLGAFSSRELALAAWDGFRRRHPALIASRQLILEPVRLNDGILHRVQTGPMHKSDALALCDRLRAANQACILVEHQQ